MHAHSHESRDGGRSAAEGLQEVLAGEFGWGPDKFAADLDELMTRERVVMPPMLACFATTPRSAAARDVTWGHSRLTLPT